MFPSARFHKIDLAEHSPIYYLVCPPNGDSQVVLKKTNDDDVLYNIWQTPNHFSSVNYLTGDFINIQQGKLTIYQNQDFWSNSNRIVNFSLKDVKIYGFQLITKNGNYDNPQILLFSQGKSIYYEGNQMIMEVEIPFNDVYWSTIDHNLGILFLIDSKKIIGMDMNNKFTIVMEVDFQFYTVKGVVVDMKKKQLLVASKNFIHFFNYGFYEKEAVDESLQQLQQLSKEYMFKNKYMDYESRVRAYFRELYIANNAYAQVPNPPHGYKVGMSSIIPQLAPYVNVMPPPTINSISTPPVQASVSSVQQQPVVVTRSNEQIDCCNIM